MNGSMMQTCIPTFLAFPMIVYLFDAHGNDGVGQADFILFNEGHGQQAEIDSDMGGEVHAPSMSSVNKLITIPNCACKWIVRYPKMCTLLVCKSF
jgi:hypothetical protein